MLRLKPHNTATMTLSLDNTPRKSNPSHWRQHLPLDPTPVPFTAQTYRAPSAIVLPGFFIKKRLECFDPHPTQPRAAWTPFPPASKQSRCEAGANCCYLKKPATHPQGAVVRSLHRDGASGYIPMLVPRPAHHRAVMPPVAAKQRQRVRYDRPGLLTRPPLYTLADNTALPNVEGTRMPYMGQARGMASR